MLFRSPVSVGTASGRSRGIKVETETEEGRERRRAQRQAQRGGDGLDQLLRRPRQPGRGGSQARRRRGSESREEGRGRGCGSRRGRRVGGSRVTFVDVVGRIEHDGNIAVHAHKCVQYCFNVDFRDDGERGSRVGVQEELRFGARE